MKETFREQGTLHIVFEYIEKSLMDILDASPGGAPIEQSRKLICQLMRALDHCHSHHVIHRDIKPENILISPADDSLRLCDFGSACNTSGGATLTDYCATRWYRAPELLVRFNNYGPGVDIWGLGCVMAELIVGQPLFTGETDIDQLFIIDNALGPLTREQNQRCFDLTNFIKFPEVGERQTLHKRLAHKISEQQMNFLARVLVVDPLQRVTAKTALTMPWLTDWSSSSAPLSARPQRNSIQAQQTPADPDFGLRPKPRVRQVVGVPGATGVSQRSSGATAGYLVAGRDAPKSMAQEPELESVRSYQGSQSVVQTPAANRQDPCEESILEEISDGSIQEDPDYGDSSPGSSPVKETLLSGESPADSSSSVAARGNKPAVGIALTSGAAVVAEQELQSSFVSLQEGSGPKQNGSQLPRKLREPCKQELTTSVQESIKLDQCEDSIMEELSEDQPSPAKIPAIPTKTLSQGGPSRAAGSGVRSVPVHPRLRPVSGHSAHSSSLTPMT